MGFKANIKDLQGRLEREYQRFRELANATDGELSEDMTDSDFDAFTDGHATRQECIDRYRARCRGRAITAGNVSREILCLINSDS